MNARPHEDRLQVVISPGDDPEALVAARVHIAGCEWCLRELRTYGQLVRVYRQTVAEREPSQSPIAAHLTDAEVAAYAGKCVNKCQAAAWEAHLADCPVCLRLLLEVWEHVKEPHAGSRALVACPKCGFRTLPADRFCPECGAPLTGVRALWRERLTGAASRWRGRRNLRLSVLGSLALIAEAGCLALGGGVVWLWWTAPLPWWTLLTLLPLGSGMYIFRRLSVKYFSGRDGSAG